MNRLKDLVIGSAAAAYAGSDSPVVSDFNWNDLSIGNDSITCERFFRKYSIFLSLSHPKLIVLHDWLGYNLTSKCCFLSLQFVIV